MLKRIVGVSCLIAGLSSSLSAFPTNIFWTPCTTEIQEPGNLRLNGFTYWGSQSRKHMPPQDAGLTLGLFSLENLGAEFGVDYEAHTSRPMYLNAKLALKSDTFWAGTPSLSLGVY